ncbi:hypothetical protein F8M41_013403 [Gigaspora margarita]|uniref:Reverse transcriptase domain-containing protein n=1 Tax=Gigaspora margarita TaxID=4874 RepID=A0A8H3WYF4_GIGMA|nr:hypothetical protein F8M41_013403 [Gigaspora margarita]
MKPILSWARSQGIRLIIYLDDILLLACSESESIKQTRTLFQFLELRVQDQYNKIQSSTITTSRISQLQNQYKNNEPKPSKAKSQQPKEGVYRNLEKTFTTYKRISHGYRKTLSHYGRSFSS